MAKDIRRRMKKKSHTETLPLELIRELLLRLPVRSVLRFKCVCKSWLSLICHPQFSVCHYDLAAASPTHRLILRSNDFYVQSINIETLLERSYDEDTVYFPLPLPSLPCENHDIYYGDIHNQPMILGSCRGLILLYHGSSEDLILWNPTIGVHKRFPNSNLDPGIANPFPHGFGYDESTDDYLLILLILPAYEPVDSTIYTFSFKTGSWKTDSINVSYQDLDDTYNVFEVFKAGSLLNGALHWLVFSREKMLPVIIAFDLIQRTVSEIPLLNRLTMENYQLFGLRLTGGCLCVCCSVQGCKTTEMWVMKEYKIQSSWTKSTVIPAYDFSPICITEDGGIFGSNSTRDGGLEKLDDRGQPLHYYGYGAELFYCINLQSAMYRESLLSLPTVIREKKKNGQQ